VYRTLILPVVLYGCETWSLTLREKYRLRIFENKVLRSIFGPKRDVTGEWRRLHNKELYALYVLLTKYHSDDHVKKEMARTCSTDGEEERVIQNFNWEP
jgi:uncharacterized membrane protein